MKKTEMEKLKLVEMLNILHIYASLEPDRKSSI